MGNVDLLKWEYVNITHGKVVQGYPYYTQKAEMGQIESSGCGSPWQDLQLTMLWFPRAQSISCNQALRFPWCFQKWLSLLSQRLTVYLSRTSSVTFLVFSSCAMMPSDLSFIQHEAVD